MKIETLLELLVNVKFHKIYIVSGFFQVPTLQNIGKFAFICGKAKSNLILALNNSLWHIVKDQLISKGNLSVFNSPKKRTWKC